MRRVLAAIMAMIMLMTSVPVLAEGSASASSAKKSGSTIDTTVSLAESVGDVCRVHPDGTYLL